MVRRMTLVQASLCCLVVVAICAMAQDAPSPKHVIILVGDGFGFNHIDAASFYQFGKTRRQVYERFPVRCAMSTFSHGKGYDPAHHWATFDNPRHGATDSAAAATAMACGIKTYDSAVGVNTEKQPVRNILEAAHSRGMRTGVVTSVQWSHATPAGFVAHKENRGMYEEIAREMVYESRADVIMGAGHPLFDNSGNFLPAPGTYKYVGGVTTWEELRTGKAGNDLDGDGVPDPWSLIETKEQFLALANGPAPRRVLGTAQVAETLQANRAGESKVPFDVPRLAAVPSLADMVLAALNVLDDDPDGFVLMVEGGAIDWASHGNNTVRMIEEVIDFNLAIEAVVEWVEQHGSWDDALVIVTADHETGYLTGPNADPTWPPLRNNGFGTLPGLEWHSGGHTNSLVPFFANGTAAQRFNERATGKDPVYGRYLDNTDIALVIFDLLE